MATNFVSLLAYLLEVEIQPYQLLRRFVVATTVQYWLPIKNHVVVL